MKYVIIGGDAAGMSAAMQILKHDDTAKITILEKGAIYSYAQCGMPYAIGGVVEAVDHLIVRSVDTFRDKFDMDARTNHYVEKVNPHEKVVSGKNTETGEAFQVTYDKLLIASGANPFVPDWEGVDLAGVHVLKTIPDTKAIIKDLARGVEDVTIVGAGYIGLEMAENFRLLGKRVRMLEMSNQIAGIFDSDIAELIDAEAKKHHIEILYEEALEKIIGETSVTAVETNKTTHETDLVLVATGVRPNTSFLKTTDVKLAENGAVEVNEWLETNVTDIYAAGDCALQYDRIKEKYVHVPLGTHANKQGRLAGLNMSGQQRAYQGMTGTSIMQFMDLTLGKVGVSEKEAEEEQILFDSVMIQTKNHAGYYPDAKDIWIKLTFHRDTGLALGAQIIGETGVDKRVDVLATALFNKMTVQGLEDLDLSYAPPYNSTWDPIQQAARKAVSKLAK